MTRAIAPPLRDYLLGTTHRKDALEGVLWEKLRRQLTGRDDGTEQETGRTAEPPHEGRGIVLPPARSQRGARCENLDAAADLGLILRDAAGIVRWEPVNPNAEHRTCPSPGNRFTVDVEVACRGGEGVQWFRYLPRNRMLAEMTGCGEPHSLERHDLVIVLRGHVDRCAQPYGDLALCLATIEIGAMLAQLALALGSTGLGAESVRFVSHGSGLDPVLYARVRAPELAGWLARAPSVPVCFAEPVRRRPDEIGGRLLRDLRTFVSSHAPELELFPHGLTVSDCGTLLRATFVRSSGLDLNAVAEGRPDGARLTALLDTICRLHSAFQGLTMLPFRLDVRLDTPLENAGWEGPAEDTPAWLHVDSASDPGGSTGYAYPGGAVIMTVSADLRDYVARTGAIFISAMHLAAGIATQIVCIAAAQAGLACRPMRSFDHAAADALLPIDCWSLIQLVVYDDRAPNPAFAL